MEEREETGQVTAFYLHADGLILQEQDGQVYVNHQDGHGSVTALTDGGETVTDSYTYDAWGTLLATTGTTPNPYRYTGESFDAGLGMYYLRARFMNTANGRFQNRDIWRGRAFEPLTLHPYLYANGNPVMGLDPSGHLTLQEVQTAVAITGTLLSVGSTAYQFHQDIRAGATIAEASRNAAAEFAIDAGLSLLGDRLLKFIPGLIKVRKAGEGVQRAANSVWRKVPVERGIALERQILGGARSLPEGFKTLDDFADGIGTSIKSIDLTSASYQTPSGLLSILKRHARALDGFTEAVSGTIRITTEDLTKRWLVVAFENGAATKEQLKVLEGFLKNAKVQFPKIDQIAFQWF